MSPVPRAARPPRIIRTARDRAHPYQIINKTFARDPRLSAEARGAMVTLLTLPDDWELRPEWLQAELKIGRDKCYKILRELTVAGYLCRERTRDARGRLQWGAYVLYENPADAPEPSTENQDVEDEADEGSTTDDRPYAENQDMGTSPRPEKPDMGKTGPRRVLTRNRPLPGLPDTVNTDIQRINEGTESLKQKNPPPPAMPIMESPCAPAAPAGGGGGPSASASAIGRNQPAQALPGAIYLAQEGFSNTAVRAWGHVAVDLLRADIERRRRDLHQQNGGIVLAWRTAPPDAPPPAPAADRTPNTDLAARLRVQLGQPQPEECSAAPPARAAAADPALRMAWQLAQLELSHADRQWLLGSHIARDGATVVLVARSSECCSAIERTLAAQLHRVLREHLGGATQLRITAHAPRNGATA